MKHRNRDGIDRHPDHLSGMREFRRGHHPDRHHEHGSPHRGRHRRRGGHGGRLFDYGDLRLLALAMLSEQPRHGYDLMRAIEERTGGSYSPSPGVIYPTLSWLEDMGYARVSAEGGRKDYLITSEGAAFLAANQPVLDVLLARLTATEAAAAPAPLLRAMENLKVALRLRLRSGPLDAGAAETIAAAIDAAAQAVERS